MRPDVPISIRDLAGLRVTVMGLGLHGGGASAARFLARRGCEVTVTDLRDEGSLAPSVMALEGLPIRYVLGRHEEADFTEADLVIKNPAVPKNSKFLSLARRVETDVSLFLSFVSPRLIAVTGSKGKSTTASAIHHCLTAAMPAAKLGGNITTSPLSFFEEVHDITPVVLELSSWQLADLSGTGLLDPEVSLVLNILTDHQNRYSGMDEYAADKMVICEGQSPNHTAVLNFDDPIVKRFAESTDAEVVYLSKQRIESRSRSAWLEGTVGRDNLDGEMATILEGELGVPGEHSRFNMLAAATALRLFGIDRDLIKSTLPQFCGIRHRLETVTVKRGVRYVNDSAATIPEATIAAVSSYPAPVHLIAGGADKKLDFSALDRLEVAGIYLLTGSATDRMIERFETLRIGYSGPYQSLTQALDQAVAKAQKGSTVLFSPGATSFEMFKNEFDRGDRFTELVKKLPD